MFRRHFSETGLCFDPRPREGATAPRFGEPNLRPGPSLRERSANLHSAAVVGRRRRGRGVRNPKSRNAFGRSRTPRGFRARLGFAEIVERPGGPVPAGGLATGRQWFGSGSAVVRQWFGSGSAVVRQWFEATPISFGRGDPDVIRIGLGTDRRGLCARRSAADSGIDPEATAVRRSMTPAEQRGERWRAMAGDGGRWRTMAGEAHTISGPSTS